MSIGRFLCGIGALLWDIESKRYLILKRSKDKDYAAGAWECVTGRVDQGEGFEDAVHREVLEEIGAEVELLAMLGTTHFFRGERRPEYELIGVVYCCAPVKPMTVRISHEHSEYRWVTAEEARAMLGGDHPSQRWLLEVIDRAEVTLSHLPEALLALHRQRGFELDN